MVLRARAVCLAEWRADEPCTARGALASPPLPCSGLVLARKPGTIIFMLAPCQPSVPRYDAQYLWPDRDL
jgi:hypothetical protein